MVKTSIGILDMNLDSISVLNTLATEFKTENLIYINDLACPNYEGLPEDVILKRVQTKVDFLLTLNMKLLVVVSNTIIEYCLDYFNSLPIPVVNIVDTIISSVNDKYSHKNMILLAKNEIINANMYQKNFEYNHLYNIASNNLDLLVVENNTKTSLSFRTTYETFKPILKRDVNVIVPTTTNLEELAIEFREYLPSAKLFDLSFEIVEKIKAALLTIENFNTRGRGKVYVYVNVNKKTVKLKHLLKIRYKLKMLKVIEEAVEIAETEAQKEMNKQYAEILKIEADSEEARMNLNKTVLGKPNSAATKKRHKNNSL